RIEGLEGCVVLGRLQMAPRRVAGGGSAAMGQALTAGAKAICNLPSTTHRGAFGARPARCAALGGNVPAHGVRRSPRGTREFQPYALAAGPILSKCPQP